MLGAITGDVIDGLVQVSDDSDGHNEIEILGGIILIGRGFGVRNETPSLFAATKFDATLP
jgi:hypothetical protein